MDKKPSVLVFSQRAVVPWVSSAGFYEFEDLIRSWSDSELLALPEPAFPLRRKINVALNRLTRAPKVASALTPPAPSPVTPSREFDLFFALLPTPDFSFNLRALRGVRERCKKMVCYVPETWGHRVRSEPHLILPLQMFDHIYVSTRNSVEAMAEVSGRPTSFLPFAVDAKLFGARSGQLPRQIDVLSIGRRSPVTHSALLNAADEGSFFYHFDSLMLPGSKDPAGHRRMYAELLNRSRYFIANKANVDEPEKTQGFEEVGHRFFEGAAAGAVMIGQPPRGQSMDEAFDWPDAVVDMPFHAEDVVERLKALDNEPERLERIRRTGTAQCLRRHDWVHRWEQILKDQGLDGGPLVAARVAELNGLADGVEAAKDHQAA